MVIEEVGRNKWGLKLWKCACDCGEYSIVTTRHLTTGNTKSCGCLSLESFRDDMYESYLEHAEEYGEKNTTLDRIDVNGDYCKENCRWITKGEQSFNRRNSTFVIYEGKTYNLTHLARKLNVDRETIKRNLIDGVYMGKKKHDQ